MPGPYRLISPCAMACLRRRVISSFVRSLLRRGNMDTDVLIVGAGPTGLMLAIQLAQRSVRVEIVDRHAGPAMQSRALGVQARTLEIYAQLGVVDRALE